MDHSTKIGRAAVAAALVAAAACMDLNVTNINEADRTRALATASDVESLISGSFRTWWDLEQGRAPGPAMASMADEWTYSAANYGAQDQGFEPARAIVNETAYQWGYWVYDPWLLSNRALASIRDGLQSIQELNLKIGDNGADNPRALAFAKFMQGLFLGNIALQYDRGFILDETVDDPLNMELAPYTTVMGAALQDLDAARQMAQQDGFSLPGGWLGPEGYSNGEFIRLTHSYQARFMAGVARSPEERGTANWAAILDHIQNGVTQDFGANLDGPSGNWQIVLKGFMGVGWNADLALLGPADQAGQYSAYEATPPDQKIAFLIDTDDRRIAGAGGPTSPGLYVHYRNSLIEPADRGGYYQSNYAPWWYYDLDQTRTGFAPDLTVKEMGYLAAEAYIRMGQPASALSFINGPRMANGQLPPATVDGVSGARCTPRAAGLLHKAAGSTRAEGECADLMQTLIYEKQMETAFQYAGSSWYDHRGFGTLRAGRAVQAPLPQVDLELLGLATYTFGGAGGNGGAP